MLVQHQGRVTRVMTTQGTNMRHRGSRHTHALDGKHTSEERKRAQPKRRNKQCDLLVRESQGVVSKGGFRTIELKARAKAPSATKKFFQSRRRRSRRVSKQ